MSQTITTRSDAQPIIVTLVHGTWARGAACCAERSLLRHTLEEEFSGRIAFEVFEWSGKNSPFHRSKAGIDLAGRLKDGFKNHPENARHYVIGHSHGGNLVCQALRGRAVQERISGIACLSTPFFAPRSRYVGFLQAPDLFFLALAGAQFILWLLFFLMFMIDSVSLFLALWCWRPLIGLSISLGHYSMRLVLALVILKRID